MLPQKAVIPLAPVQNLKQQLDLLYARRTAIDALIQTLTEYDQLRQPQILKQKTA
jgi:hypothetical protein